MATYKVNVQGYGAEMVFARITKEQYEYWKPLNDEESDAINQHLFFDPEDDDQDNEITDAEDPRWLGLWYDLPGTIEQCHGAEAGSAWLRVYNAEDEMILEKDIGADVVQADKTNAATEGEGYYILCQSVEKGTFITAEINTDEDIDPDKFTFYGVMLDSESFSTPMVTSCDYDGEELQDDGGDTNGKGYYVDFIKHPADPV